MQLPEQRTKIVATIGPASGSPGTLERLIGAGLNIARLDFSHGDFAGHAERVVSEDTVSGEQAGKERIAVVSKRQGMDGLSPVK